MNETIELKSTDYDNLFEEKLAFQQAGMTQKVKEWDYKIRLLEVSSQYSKITIKEIYKQFGIEELNKILAGQNDVFGDKAREICEEIIHFRTISESKLYDFIDRNKFRYENDPKVTREIFKLISKKLSKNQQIFFKQLFALDKGITEKVAFVKIEKIKNYKQNDNPPMQELMKVVFAKNKKILKGNWYERFGAVSSWHNQQGFGDDCEPWK